MDPEPPFQKFATFKPQVSLTASQNGGQKRLELAGSGLDLCFASSPMYHYSLKCRKVGHQAL